MIFSWVCGVVASNIDGQVGGDVVAILGMGFVGLLDDGPLLLWDGVVNFSVG